MIVNVNKIISIFADLNYFTMKKIILFLLVISSHYLQAQARWVVDVGVGVPFDVKTFGIRSHFPKDNSNIKYVTGFGISIKSDVRIGKRFNIGLEFNTSSFKKVILNPNPTIYLGPYNATYKRILIRVLWNSYYRNEKLNTYWGFATGPSIEEVNKKQTDKNTIGFKFMYGARYVVSNSFGISSEFSFGAAPLFTFGGFYKIK